MKLKFIKYSITTLAIAGSFWFYFQISTYPYKVDRWFQPAEAKLVSITTKHCSAVHSWLGLFVDHAVTYQGAYSAQVAFIDPNNQQQNCEVGYKDKLFSIPVNSAYRYRYASTSKLITIAAVNNLVNQGKLRLEDTLVSFLPELTEFDDSRIQQITIAHLLNHKAGFNRLSLNGDPMFLRGNKPWCPNKLSELQNVKLVFAPGEKQIYSNLGYCLLGEVIHRVTSEQYRAYIQREFSLASRNIKFVGSYFYEDEVRYDYRYEDWYNDTYLKLFDFDAISSAAGLSGSATSLANLLWDIHHAQIGSPFYLQRYSDCKLRKKYDCLSLGMFHYQPESKGIALLFHEGYLPGSASVAVIDSFGGVTVLLKSGANRYQKNPENEWVKWIYRRLSLHYTLQGHLPILNDFESHRAVQQK